jgi:hypothetical protein
MAAVADGWFASAYNATPTQYHEARVRLDNHLRAAGREPDDFPDAIATMWLFVTESRREAEHVLTDVLAPALRRDPGQLVDLPIGSAEHCAEVLAGYAKKPAPARCCSGRSATISSSANVAWRRPRPFERLSHRRNR